MDKQYSDQKMDKQYSDQKNKEKGQTMIYKTICRKL